MLLIKKILGFGASTEEMVHIWNMYCRSILEQSAVVWSSSLTQENIDDLERTQKCFTKLILKEKYSTYSEALLLLNMETLENRRSKLLLQFAEKCLKNYKFSNLFPTNQKTGLRKSEKYKVGFCNTERMRRSSIIQMQHQLNTEHRNQQETKNTPV